MTANSFEPIEQESGNRPVLNAMGEIAGRLIVSIAARDLQARRSRLGTAAGGPHPLSAERTNAPNRVVVYLV